MRRVTETWLEDYNTERPHDSLGQVPPREYLPRLYPGEESKNQVST